MKRADIKTVLNDWGYDFAEHAPGDGATRYKIGRIDEVAAGYFAARDTHTITALGKSELEHMARGIAFAMEAEG